jgi:hypothetical protein
MTAVPLRRLAAAGAGLLVWCGTANAQFFPPPQQQPAAAPQSQICMRLESQLAALDRGTADPGRAEQIRRYEESAGRQQAELDRAIAQSRRLGCEGMGLLSLFTPPPAQCPQLISQIRQMRSNLDRMLVDLERVRGGSAERETERRSILLSLGQYECGPQYRAAVQNAQRGFFDQLFGSNTMGSPVSAVPGDGFPSSNYRTVCVRTCDGFYFPISYSTVPARFGEDEQKCQRQCPASEVALFAHRNPGEDIAQAVSINGRPYTELPNAFRYRREHNPSCSCRQPGQSWSEALKNLDDRSTLERGDIVVTEERARAMSQPRDAQGRPLKPAASPARQETPQAQPTAPASTESGDAPADGPPPGKRTIRNVGPVFIPAR